MKALFSVQRRAPVTFEEDSGALLFDTNTAVTSTLTSYQYRIGGRYFPAAPVQCALSIGSVVTNGGCEAFLELEKALNVVSDYRLSTGCNSNRWAIGINTALTYWPEYDYTTNYVGWDVNGHPITKDITAAHTTDGNTFAGNVGSNCFAMAIDLETSNGIEVSGLNAEEQSDIQLIAQWSKAQTSGFVIETYAYVDKMIILRENNVMEIVM